MSVRPKPNAPKKGKRRGSIREAKGKRRPRTIATERTPHPFPVSVRLSEETLSFLDWSSRRVGIPPRTLLRAAVVFAIEANVPEFERWVRRLVETDGIL